MTTRAYGGAINGATNDPQATLAKKSWPQGSRLYDRSTIDKHLDMNSGSFASTWTIDAVLLAATAIVTLRTRVGPGLLILMMDVMVDKRGELHAGPAMTWIASFTFCTLADVMLGRWVLVPLFVAGFYGGTFIIASVTYPMLSFWRAWLRRRGLLAWYLIEVGRLWGGTTLVLVVLSPWWLRWSWSGMPSLQGLGLVLFVASVVAGTWALAKMGWARLLLTGALFPPGAAAEENGVPQWLVVSGPYRYVRNPLYVGDFCLILGAALLTCSWALVFVAALYVVQLFLQLPWKNVSSGSASAFHTTDTASSYPVSFQAAGPCNSETSTLEPMTELDSSGKGSGAKLPRRVFPIYHEFPSS